MNQTLKVEEGVETFRGDSRGGPSGRGNEERGHGESKWIEKISKTSQRGDSNKGRVSNNNDRGSYGNRITGSHFNNTKCYECGKLGHPAYRCLEKASTSYGEKKITYMQK